MAGKSIRSSKYRKVINLLQQERLKKHMTQRDLGLKLKRPQSYIAKYESLTRRLDILEFMEVCAALEIRPSKVMVLTQ